MKSAKLKANLLVTGQFTLLILFIIRHGFIASNIAGLLIQAVALILLVSAVISMKIVNVQISPLVKKETELAQYGPYRFIRHPMYTSVLLFTAPFILTITDLVIYILLCGLLIVKLKFEEKLLEERFTEYASYRKNSWRLIPFIY